MILMASALVLALVAAVISVLLRDVPERAAASERETTESPPGPLIYGDSPPKPWRERATPWPAPEVSKDDSGTDSSEGEPRPEFAAPRDEEEPQPEPVPRSEPLSQPDTQAQAGPEAQSEPLPRPEPRAHAEPKAIPNPEERTTTVGETGWQAPTPQEIEAANEPRQYEMPTGAIMTLTMDSIGIHGAPVFDSAGQRALANGVAHLPDTSLPWSPTLQRNVYLAGHRMGYRGTWSRMIFYNLGKLGKGDKVVLKDRSGRAYEYRVSESFIADPTDSWVTGQIQGKDMLTLQTCTPIPTFEKRLIVRADRI